MYKKNLTWTRYVSVKTSVKSELQSRKARLSRSRSFCLLFFFLLLISAAQAQVLRERVKVKFTNTSLQQALKTLEAKADVRFVYNDGHMKTKNLVNGNYEGSLESVVKQLLSSYQLTFDFVDNQYIVLRNPKKGEDVTIGNGIPEGVNQNGFVQSGVVIDEKGNPLAGVVVTVRRAGNIVQTDQNGYFNIGVVDDSYTLEFRYLGYKNVAQKSQRNALMKLELQLDQANLDEVIVVGYGTTTRRNNTGSTVSIKAEEIMNTPATNFANALQGRAAGVQIVQSNGLPGSPMRFTIRGQNSLITAGSTIDRNAPLIVVDGVPYLSDAINGTVGAGLNGANAPSGGASPLNLINPMDIESVDILKDADATAIYGSRAANGVILITTKKGKAGRTQVDGLFRHGVAKVSHFVETMNTEQYLAMRRTAFANAANANTTPERTNAFDLTTWDQTAYTDFQKLLIGNTAQSTDANLSISGGDQRTNFRLSGTFHKEGNVFIGDQGYNRSAVNFNMQHKSANERFNLGFSAIYAADDNNVALLDQTSIAYNLPPNYPLYNEDGSLYWSGISYGVPANPLAQLNQVVKNKGTNLIGNLNLGYRLWKGLHFKTNFGYGKSDMDQKRLTPKTALDPGLATSLSNSFFAYNVNDTYSIEPQLDYSTDIAKGKLSAMLGSTWQHSVANQPSYISANDFASDEFLENIASARTMSISKRSSEYKYSSIFGRLNYNWDGKYIVNGTFRRDGSSRFAPNARFGNFGSVGAAWIMSEENFLKSIPQISFAKIRSSYGWVGNDKIADYGYFDSYGSSSYVFNGVTSLVPARLANNTFRWEQTAKFEAALELGLFEDRLSFTGAFYRNRSGNQLVNQLVSPQTGWNSYQANFPALVENKGWEFTLSSTNIQRDGFRWRTDFNLSLNRNKLIDYPNIKASSYASSLVIGHPMNPLYAYEYIGFDEATGLPAFRDFNEDGKISTGLVDYALGDRYLAGTTLPKYFGGLSNTISYKNFTLDFLFQFVKQKGRSILAQSWSPPGYGMTNFAAAPIMDYLSQGSSEQLQVAADFTNAYTAWSNYTYSSASIVDASFIRLKNVSLSYDIKGTFVERLRFKNLRLQVQGHNLFTVTDYVGFDPESQGLSLPPLRTVVGTLQFTF
ncbi:SusC/RagA family TonB-linked outer membrane protein [Sphingobacterium bambusae]|uniref:SusC/RagA family TonB-linked outer membrane protein n=1 Tax=Sphingobacterium bambusae TaxID=662858 RepID=A0ABW6BLI3_9SPHI|nr:SusC/RagA family TonB-linked outer membrane protein [Sphingobacterium bambusae]WPL49079.1 SusC/RagA family TonB-linked outer membrane protein [Sphingobacterium bambusae]